jgi:peptide/nickel transport system permease protein
MASQRMAADSQQPTAPANGGAWRTWRKYRGGMFGLAIVIVFMLVALLAPLFAPADPLKMGVSVRLQPPGGAHLLGTDQYGRDLLSRLIYGARPSLIVGFLSMGLGVLVGTAMGIVSGYFGGLIDKIISFVMDVMMSFPAVLLGMAMVAAFGANLPVLVVVISVVQLPTVARVVRGQTILMKGREFIEASHALGARSRRILLRAILPNISGPIIAIASLGMAQAVILEAAFGFLGLGIQPPAPSWGTILSEGREYLRTSPHITTLAGLCIVALAMGFNLVGDALRDMTDPHTRKSLH